LKPLPTYERVTGLLHYEPETGVFTWRHTCGDRHTIAGQVAGGINVHGYRAIRIDGGRYRANRLAWLWMTGDWPTHIVDHENGIKADDRWSNLRAATKSQNNANSRLKSNNKSGFKGVVYREKFGKWTAQITVNRTHRYLGAFDSPEAAHEAWLAAAKEAHGEFARAR